jgi:hypothetical protein
VVRREQRLLHGCFGSFAVGCVEVRARRAKFDATLTGRQAILGCSEKLPAVVEVRVGLLYEPHSADGTELQDPVRALQKNMRRAEENMARKLADQEDTLVICDGPLSFGAEGRGEAVGYIKRISKFYLPASLLPLVASLPPGCRTPLFGIQTRGDGFARFAWYLRLAPVTRGDSELHGLVRLEVSKSVGMERGRLLADLTASLVPRFAPPRGRDPRAPQNLYPIGALEQQLRRSLGDQALVRRWIEVFIAREADHA